MLSEWLENPPLEIVENVWMNASIPDIPIRTSVTTSTALSPR